jgi:hypothetical protein
VPFFHRRSRNPCLGRISAFLIVSFQRKCGTYLSRPPDFFHDYDLSAIFHLPSAICHHSGPLPRSADCARATHRTRRRRTRANAPNSCNCSKRLTAAVALAAAAAATRRMPKRTPMQAQWRWLRRWHQFTVRPRCRSRRRRCHRRRLHHRVRMLSSLCRLLITIERGRPLLPPPLSCRSRPCRALPRPRRTALRPISRLQPPRPPLSPPLPPPPRLHLPPPPPPPPLPTWRCDGGGLRRNCRACRCPRCRVCSSAIIVRRTAHCANCRSARATPLSTVRIRTRTH